MDKEDLYRKCRKQDPVVYEKKKTLFAFTHDLLHKIMDVPAVLIKGEVLSIMAYGCEGYRDYHDIDLLVSRNNVKAVCRILEDAGYEQFVLDESGNKRMLTRNERIFMANSHQTAPYFKSFPDHDTIEIDVNVDIFWGEYKGRRLDMNQLIQHAVDIPIFNHQLKTLSPIDTFIQVCLHHYKEMNGAYFFVLKNAISVPMFQDVYQLFINQIHAQFNQYLSYIRTHNLQTYLYYMLYYANRIFQDKKIEESLKKLYDPSVDALLEYYGLNDGERHKWNIGFWERLDHGNLFDVIKNDLTKEEQSKVEQCLRIH